MANTAFQGQIKAGRLDGGRRRRMLWRIILCNCLP
jgi:hypothetical protein